MRGDEPGGPIHWKIYIPVPPETVFAAFATDDGRATFWAESAIERDGHIDFQFINGVTHRSRILARDPPVRFELDYFGSTATIELTADGEGGTDLSLTHAGVVEEDWNEVHAGWLNVLFPLKAALAFGVDLRSHDPKRLWDDGYVDQ